MASAASAQAAHIRAGSAILAVSQPTAAIVRPSSEQPLRPATAAALRAGGAASASSEPGTTSRRHTMPSDNVGNERLAVAHRRVDVVSTIDARQMLHQSLCLCQVKPCRCPQTSKLFAGIFVIIPIVDVGICTIVGYGGRLPGAVIGSLEGPGVARRAREAAVTTSERILRSAVPDAQLSNVQA